MKKRLKRTTKQYIIVSLLSVIIIGGAFVLIYVINTDAIKDKYQREINLISEKLETHKVYVYEAKEDIPVGSRVTKDKLNYIETYSNQSKNYYMTEDDIGKVTLIEVEKGIHILKGMLTQDIMDSSVREVEYNTFLISSNMKENDVIDVRLMLPNGEDYIVLSKKNIKNIAVEDNNCFLWLTEEEILNMSGAIVDAYLYAGTKLYTTRYIEPNLQVASIPTYHPSIASLTLMEQDDNIIEKASKEVNKRLRKELETRLAAHQEVEIANSDWNTDNNRYSDINWEGEVEDKTNKGDIEGKTGEDYFVEEDMNSEEVIEYGE